MTVADAAESPWQGRFAEAVIGAAHVLVAVLDEQGRYVRFNRECERLSGWAAPEVIGRTPWETVLPPDSAAEVHALAFEAAMRSARPDTPTHATHEWLTRDGRRRLIAWTNTVLAAPDGAGSAPGQGRCLVSVGIDITDSHAAQQALAASESRLRRAQRVSQTGAWELDLVSGRLQWSDEVYRLFEIDPARSVGSYAEFLAVVHPDDVALVDEAYARSVASDEPYVIEHRLRMPDGRIKWVEERCETEFDVSGRPIRSLGTVQDVTARHQATNALARFERMVEQVSQEIWLVDASGLVHYVNPAAAQSLGYAQGQLVGRPMAQIDTGGQSLFEQLRRQARARAAAGQAPQVVEVSHRAADGRLVPKELRTTLVELDGETFGCSFAFDITERRQLQAMLQSQATLLQATLDAYPGWVACADDDMRYVFVSERLATSLGYTRAQIIGKTVDEVRGRNQADELRAINRRLLAGEQVQMERRYIGIDGVEHLYWVVYLVMDDPTRPGRHTFYAFGTDIGEMRQTQVRLQTIVEGTRLGTWEWDVPTGQVAVNAQLPMLTGHDLADTGPDLAAWLRAQMHPADFESRKAHIRSLLQGQTETVECEYRVRHRDGHWVWVLERGRTVSLTEQGLPLLVIGTTQDISAIKRTDEALRSLTDELEQRVETRTRELAAAVAEAERASAAKTEFLSRMSHELRTPLNAIIGFGQLLQLAPLPPAEAEYAHEVVRAGRHLLALINEVLDLATVESGRIDLTLQPVALRALVDECLALIRPAAAQADLTIDCQVHADCLPVRADRGRLKQVLINLLSNAVKYNRPGGQVVIDCHCEPGGVCEVRVADTGQGLSAEQLARVFLPFERLGAQGSAVEGTGIGLSVCKRLVEAMGGQIGAGSEPGRGSRFWLRLPTETAEPAPQPADRPSTADTGAGSASGQRRKLLLVEDNAANLLLMQHIVARRHDLELVSTADPRQALALLQQHQPQLVLLDIQLPHLDGYQVLSLLQQAGVTVPVVAFSANAMPADVARGIAAGFDDYLSKPVDIQRLMATIDGLLPLQPKVDVT